MKQRNERLTVHLLVYFNVIDVTCNICEYGTENID